MVNRGGLYNCHGYKSCSAFATNTSDDQTKEKLAIESEGGLKEQRNVKHWHSTEAEIKYSVMHFPAEEEKRF